jgi:hypothetical protein
MCKRILLIAAIFGLAGTCFSRLRKKSYCTIGEENA